MCARYCEYPGIEGYRLVNHTIENEEQLRAFRETWSGQRMLELLKESNGQMLVNWSIGVGKSVNIDDVIEAAVSSAAYDLVVALFPTRRIIEERRWVKNPPPGIKVINLRPRPRKKCGDKDEAWQRYEAADLGLLGRIQICGMCKHRSKCLWPDQYGGTLEGAKVIFAAQSHLSRSPSFLRNVIRWAGATRVLIVLDEVNVIASSYQKSIAVEDLSRFVDVLMTADIELNERERERLRLVDLLCKAQTNDLQCPDWKFPWFSTDWTFAVQNKGMEKYGDKFRFLGFDLQEFSHSPLESRERTANGKIAFAAPPFIGCDLMLYSGTVHPEFAEYRLGQKVANPFSDYVFKHHETKWYNLASRLGTRQCFKSNAPQTLDFFAQLIAKRMKGGRRPLLIAKKCLMKFCAVELEQRLKEFGVEGVTIVYQDWGETDLNRPGIVPLINYGMIGTNIFETFDCAYCLTGYYVNEDIVDSILQDVLSSDRRISIKIKIDGRPRRRVAEVQNSRERVYDVHRLAQLALNQQEMDCVIQAVGRVRPYTMPREVITFQCSENPQFPYTHEFNSVGEAREYFNIPTRQAWKKDAIVSQIQSLKKNGKKQTDVANDIDVSLCTVKRYWNNGGYQNPSIIYYKGILTPGLEEQ